MNVFAIDRESLPKPWEAPLVFALTGNNRAVVAEISADAALEYREAGRARGAAAVLSFQRREDFLQAVEAAVERLIGQDESGTGRLVLSWDDLYPPDPRRG